MELNPAALTALRLAYGLTVTALAERVDVSRSHLANIEQGRRQSSPRLNRSLAKALGVPLAALTVPCSCSVGRKAA